MDELDTLKFVFKIFLNYDDLYLMLPHTTKNSFQFWKQLGMCQSLSRRIHNFHS